ncbi:type II CAAX endopeptidase family protein [Levilactobacillus zymae]|uniref:CPBP family intramembrane glutamic endopeptidase n=1 Tax=Levilactobacillus zymae TaxID=267363 RepID=UPI0028BC4453|nr:type II CAAX endopeptidase family protein [Levilactobacillus zymae]MDT6980289.1 type II CAAX endopeptidase family protein [Levilactobacillus zymae]
MPQPQQRVSNQNWLWLIGLVILTGVIQRPLLALTTPNGWQRVLWSGVYLLGFGVTVGLAAWVYQRISPRWQRLTRADWGMMVKGYVFILVVEQGLTWLNRVWFHQVSTANNQAIAALLKQGLLVQVLLSFTAICVSPFIEEFIFRGILIDGCLDGLSFWPPVVISGIAFALVHANSTVASWLIYAVMGGTFAYIYRKTGKLQSTIILHGLNNLLAMGILLWGLYV